MDSTTLGFMVILIGIGFVGYICTNAILDAIKDLREDMICDCEEEEEDENEN